MVKDGADKELLQVLSTLKIKINSFMCSGGNISS